MSVMHKCYHVKRVIGIRVREVTADQMQVPAYRILQAHPCSIVMARGRDLNVPCLPISICKQFSSYTSII